jgi:hypothetical protein
VFEEKESTDAFHEEKIWKKASTETSGYVDSSTDDESSEDTYKVEVNSTGDADQPLMVEVQMN